MKRRERRGPVLLHYRAKQVGLTFRFVVHILTSAGGSCGRSGAPSLQHCLPEEIFDLAIHASQFIRRPTLQVSPELGIDPQ